MMPLTPAAASGSRPWWRAAAALAGSAASGGGTRPGASWEAEYSQKNLYVPGLPGHREEALNDLDRGIRTSDRELEGLLLRHQPIPQGTKRCSCLRRFSIACFALRTRARGEAWPLGLGLLSSAMRFSSAPSLA